jgi:DNA-binding transcriptional ArsR family regulator
MVEALFGSLGAERVLCYLENYGEGYATEIARTFGMALVTVQKQLSKFEDAGVLVFRNAGRTKVYTWNPRFVVLEPLRNLLRETLKCLPREEIEKYYRKRTRPRRSGKPE